MPRGGVLARLYRPGGSGFELSFCSEVRNSRIKNSPGVLPEGWSELELTDTLCAGHVDGMKK